jgi:hypothetical protein
MSSEQDDLQKLLETTADEQTGAGDNPAALESTASPDQEAQKPGDRVPRASDLDVDIPDDELTQFITANFRNELIDREDMGWTDKRAYDKKAYYEIKDQYFSTFPYKNASNYPVCITSVQLDTGLSLINDLIWRNPQKVVTVSPNGDENPKKAMNVEYLLNWQVLNDIPTLQMEDAASNFFALLHGTAYEKVLREYSDEYKLEVTNIPIQYMILPIDRKSPDIKDTEAVTQLVPWSANDLRMRVASGRYRNLNKVGKSWMPQNTTAEILNRMDREISGLDTVTKVSRDTWWAAERYMTYYPKGSMRAVELIVTFAPQTGAILRKIKNVENLRPFVDKYFYPNYGYAYHFSLPERIKHIQDKANYQDKQITDAADKAISPAGFYEGNSGFDPKLSLRVPTGMYPVKNLGTIQWEPVNIAAIMERNRDLKDLWLQAERKTGFTDMLQGISTSTSAQTLGQDQMRQMSANVRFGEIRKLVNYHWKRKMELIYRYDDMYMPRDVKVKVLGQNRYESIEKLFPREQVEGQELPETGLGLTGKFNFGICNKSIQEQEKENGKRSALAGAVLADPMYATDKGTHYRALEMQWEANGIYELEYIVKRPPEASIPTPDEVIERLMDGEQLQPDINMNPMEYIPALEAFTKTGNFRDVKDIKIRQSFGVYLTILDKMRQASILAFHDQMRLSGLQNALPPGINPPQGTVTPGNPASNGKAPAIPANQNGGGQ